MRRKPLTSLPAILLACALLPAPWRAHAAETVTAGDVYVTATRIEKELQQVPMSVTVMSAGDVRKSGARTVGELLQDVPGVQIQNDGSQGLKRISIRGEDPFRTLVLIDGQKISEHKSMSGSPILIDASRIERVEVIKGPASVLYGSDAIGGVVNIITRKGGGKPIEGEVFAGFSGASRGFSEGLSVAGGLNGFKYRLSGSHSDQGDVRTPDGRLDNTNFRQTDVSAFLSYDFSDAFTLGGGAEYYKGAFNSTAVTYANDPNSDFFVKVPEWSRRKYYLFAEARELSEYLSRVRFDVYYQKTEKDMQNYVKTGVPAGERYSYSGTPVTMRGDGHVAMDNYADNFIRSRGLSLQTDWQLGADNFLVAGYELTDDRLDSVGRTHIDIFLPFVSPVMGMVGEYVTTRYYDGTQLNHSLFASMETQLPWDLALTYGVRWTHVKTKLTRGDEYRLGRAGLARKMGGAVIPLGMTVYGGERSGGVSPGDDTESRPVFNVGLVWTGIENLALRASWAQGFRVPNLTEKYIGTSMGGGTIWGNPSLRPETSNNFEVGARWNDGVTSIDAAVFYSLADDYIASVPTAVSGEHTYINVADATTFGAELAVSRAFDTAWGRFTPYVSGTWMRRQYDDGRGWKTYNTATPRLIGRYGVRYAKALNDSADVFADAYLRSQSATKYSSRTGTSDYELGGFTTANLSFGLDFGAEKNFSLVAEVLNILDKTYQYNSAIIEPGLHANVKLVYKF